MKLNFDDEIYQTLLIITLSHEEYYVFFPLNNTNSCLDCLSTVAPHFAPLDMYIIALFK
jgi:hypothetical protein